MRVALLTGRAARRLVEEVAGGRDDVVIVELPVNVVSMLTANAVAAMLRSRRDLLEAARSADVVIVPGSVRGDVSVVAEVVGKPAFKGTRTTAGIPFILEHLKAGGRLDTLRPAEEVLGEPPALPPGVEAFRVSGVPVPARGPPPLLAAEVPPEAPRDSVAAEAARLAAQGARVVVVGASPSMEPGELAARVSQAAKALGEGVALGAEAPTPRHAREAARAGASLIATSPGNALEASEHAEAVVVADRDVSILEEAVARLAEVGYTNVIVDPVVDVPPLGFTESLERYRRAAGLGKPLLFAAANVAGEVEADSHGVHALLALIAAELGASVYLVVEDSWKTRWSVSEAREAVRLAWEAWRRKTTERGMFSRLLVVKQQAPPPSVDSRGAFEVCRVEPRIDPAGYLVIGVDHDEKYVVAEWVSYAGDRVRFRGRHAPSLARALVRAVGLNPEHAAYLGYELAKAEIALALERAYTQDEPVIVPVWDVDWLGCGVGPGQGDTGRGALRSEGGEGGSGQRGPQGEG